MNDPSESQIFDEALKLQPEARRAYVETACSGERSKFERIIQLLEAHAAPDSLLAETTESSTRLMEMEGSLVGRYKLLQQLGEGGFGTVFMAEQTEPIRRKVALKIIKPGMDSKAVVARFEAERQALAMMDHPHIATVLDGGTTQSGRPYFVMELVRGVSITDYCDRKRLPTSERLQLFDDVCSAVQHAHQKGIIHRDLKPSNVMVTLHDGTPIVKVIDFGVAKAVNQQLTEKTLFTRYGQMIGTPQYMSPEQAEMSGLDVDTRSDVYSLGVLLYELLTGTTPLTSERLYTAGYAEMQRIICEERLVKPSTRLSATAEQELLGIADSRSASPTDLRKELSGDLDWIVMKSLEKDRSRRYESVTAFQADVGRFLNDEPVVARPPSKLYRTRMWMRRNRALAIGITSVILTLSVGIVASLISLAEARSQARQKDAALVSLRDVLFDNGLKDVVIGNVSEAQQTVGHLRSVPESEQLAVLLEAFLATQDERHADAVALLEPMAQEVPDSAAVRGLLTYAYEGMGDLDRYWPSHVELAELHPQSVEELLFNGMPLGIDPAAAVEMLTKAIKQRPSPLLYLYRGRLQADWALQAGRIDLLPGAVDDVEKATSWLELRGNAGTEAFRTYVMLAHVARAASDDRLHDEMMNKANAAIDALGTEASRGWFNQAFLANYEYARGEKETALRIYQESAQNGNDFAAMFYFLLAYQLGVNPAEELLRPDSQKGDYSAVGRVLYFCMTDNRQDASRLASSLLGRAKSFDSASTAVRPAIWFANAQDNAFQEAAKRWENTPRIPWDDWLRRNGPIYHVNHDDEQFINSAKDTRYRARHLTYAYARCAEYHFGRGDFQQARRMLQRCRDQHVLYLRDYYWARALLARHPKLKGIEGTQ